MANDKYKINELVSDDQLTVELDLPKLQPAVPRSEVELESLADTCGLVGGPAEDSDASISELKSDLRSRSETINRLQYDIEQLRAKWLGLEIEISAREDITEELNEKLDEQRASLSRKDKQLRKRDRSVQSLKAEIRERHDGQQYLQDIVADLREQIERAQDSGQVAKVDNPDAAVSAREKEIRELRDDNDTPGQHLQNFEDEGTQQNRRLLAEQAGQLASNNLIIRELHEQFERSEKYADSLRQKLQDLQAANVTASWSSLTNSLILILKALPKPWTDSRVPKSSKRL